MTPHFTEEIEMSEQPGTLEEPDQIRDATGERRDGRPTGGDEATIRPGVQQDTSPMVAPEEKGGSPSTEHAPGGDL
jgi:hypothetical protein